MRGCILAGVTVWSLCGLRTHASFHPIDTYEQLTNTIYQYLDASYYAGELSDQERVLREGKTAMVVLSRLRYPRFTEGSFEESPPSFRSPKIIVFNSAKLDQNGSPTLPSHGPCKGRKKDYSMLATQP